jgi:flavorubredoxin
VSADLDTPTLPRELKPGVFWMGRCLEQPFTDGQILHVYNSVFLVKGSERSLLVESGFPADWETLDSQLDQLLEHAPPLTYVFPTHAEIPHASGLGRLLDKYPDVSVIGEVKDYHLIFPEIADRLLPLQAGDSVDLGGTEFVILDAVIKDLVGTFWGFDTQRKVLFPGDGFAYMHHHDAGQCARLADEVPQLPFVELAQIFTSNALYWTRFTDVEPYIEKLDRLLEELDVQMIAPTHGLPISDLEQTIPQIREGLRVGAA